MENLNFTAYLIYVPTAIGLLIWVTQKLFNNNIVFMIDIFKNNDVLASSTNKMLKIGFYLLNAGVAFNTIYFGYINTKAELLMELTEHLGGYSVYLGIVLFAFLIIMFVVRKKSITVIK